MASLTRFGVLGRDRGHGRETNCGPVRGVANVASGAGQPTRAMERKVNTSAAVISLALSLFAVISPARAGDAETIAAVNKAAAALDHAFEHQDADAIKRLVTSDHLAVTPYYDHPTSAAAQIESLSDLKYEQTIIGEAKITLLGAAAAMRTFEARLDGTFKGKTIPPQAFVTSIMVEEGGAWREKFYQVTALTP
jgi:Domain of unknown function (DUF4440)